MAIANEQLKQIFLELQAKFSGDQYISIIPLGGEYSEKYEIKYNILGVALFGSGTINETRDNSIFISIPFGFPHFPPSCRPQSTTFHPDFDQAAICIGDFWNKDKTLSELIIQIGRMISGEIYSSENAFNETAVEWYKKNKDRLPFEKLTFSSEVVLPENNLELQQETVASRKIDTLDDSDFSADSDYLNLEKSEGAEEDISFPATAQVSSKGPLDEILSLIRQKKYYELSSILSTLPAEDSFEDREEIENNVEEVLNKAQKLQKEADELEHQGNATEALRLLEKIADLVPDFPNIAENLDRTKKTTQLAEEWTQDNLSSADSDQTEGSLPASDTAQKRHRQAFFDKKQKASLKIIPIIAAVIVLVLIVAVIAPLFTVNSRLKKAEEIHSQCISLLEKEKFPQALQSCESAQLILNEIYFFKKLEQAAMSAKIKQTIVSEKMQQGLSGKIIFHGKYVRKKDKEIVLAFEKVKLAADTFFKQKLWAKAFEAYTSALSTVEPIQDSYNEKIIKAVTENHTIAHVNVLLNKGSWFLAAGELKKSLQTFDQAGKIVQQLPTELQEAYTSEIDSKLSEIEYLQLLDLGKNYFASNDWESAIKQYEKALKLHSESSLTEKQGEVETLYSNMAEAELYALISSGKEAFAKSQLDQAISQYRKAIELLEEKKSLLKRINPSYIQQQLEHIILRSKIVQNKQNADSQLEKHQYREAISSFRKVIDLITESGLQNDKEFIPIFSGAQNSITEARKKADKEEKIVYLTKNYKQIFQDNYSAAIPDYLKDPKASFVKNIGKKQLFELKCLEVRQGRKARLVMLYLFDPDTKNWQFYSENN